MKKAKNWFEYGYNTVIIRLVFCNIGAIAILLLSDSTVVARCAVMLYVRNADCNVHVFVTVMGLVGVIHIYQNIVILFNILDTIKNVSRTPFLI